MDRVHPSFQQMPYWDRAQALAAINRGAADDYQAQFAGTPNQYGYGYQYHQNQAKQLDEFATRARLYNMPQGNMALLPRIGSTPQQLAGMMQQYQTSAQYMTPYQQQYLGMQNPQRVYTNFGHVSPLPVERSGGGGGYGGGQYGGMAGHSYGGSFAK
jgi:hypothetical protein